MEAVQGIINATRPIVSPLFISDSCFDTLLVDWNLLDTVCLKETISKVAGYGIVLFSSFLKFPLILNILRSKSVDGLSTFSIYLETTLYASVLVFHYFIQSPFSTYGEKYVLLAQNVLIAFLIWVFAGKGIVHRIAASFGLVASIAGMLYVPKDYWHYLILYSTVGVLASRLPQIAVNFSNGHTGVLSVVTMLASVLGGAVRLLTVVQEVDDVFAVIGEVLPLGLNIVILLQILFYKKATAAHFLKDKEKKDK